MKKILSLIMLVVLMVGCDLGLDYGCEESRDTNLTFDSDNGSVKYSTQYPNSHNKIHTITRLPSTRSGSIYGKVRIYDIKKDKFVKLTTHFSGNCESDRYVDSLTLYGPIIDTTIIISTSTLEITGTE